eukprot:GEZU01001133.1.p1 GENE.GEZU01001133.1~~GEZU01001133.1.p1  ORF type:complete len:251 (+),score=58.22 GEZU01001133.1:119-871(+)
MVYDYPRVAPTRPAHDTEQVFTDKGYPVIHRTLRTNMNLFEAAIRNFLNTPYEPRERVRAIEGLRKWWEAYMLILEEHHHRETVSYFKWIAQRASPEEFPMDTLDGQHEEIEDLIKEVTNMLNSQEFMQPEDSSRQQRLLDATVALNRELQAHLKQEEDLVIPAVTKHFTRAEQDQMCQNIVRSFSLKELSLHMPFMCAVMDEEEKKEIFGTMPVFLKLMNRFSWKPNYDKLVKNAGIPQSLSEVHSATQ